MLIRPGLLFGRGGGRYPRGAALSLPLATGPLPSAITFTRTGAKNLFDATGKLRSIASGAAPFQVDPETLLPLGLLVEDQVTSMGVTQNDAFDNAAWTKTGLLDFGSGSVANSTATLDPWDTNTADLLIADTSTGNHGISRTAMAVSPTAVATLQVMLKAAGYPQIVLEMDEAGGTTNGTWARFDTAKGVVRESGKFGTGVAPTQTRVRALKNGFVQLTLSGKPSTTGTQIDFYIRLAGDDAAGPTISFTGDGVSGVYLAGVMLEAGEV